MKQRRGKGILSFHTFPLSFASELSCVFVFQAYEADGNFDERKAKGLVRLFRPDKFDELSLLAFVQSCDGVYKKLRYLRASVGNSTLIDYVLENIFNAFFYFFLALTIMAVLELNPWTLLVSLSTIMVSFAFAVGPSAAKLIEGMMMIAIRRPFDLGDRISVSFISLLPFLAFVFFCLITKILLYYYFLSSGLTPLPRSLISPQNPMRKILGLRIHGLLKMSISLQPLSVSPEQTNFLPVTMGRWPTLGLSIITGQTMH